MATGDKNYPVDLVVVEATKIDGEHVPVGMVLKKVDTDTAFELAAAGKVRAWTKELEADMKARAKAEADFAAKSAKAVTAVAAAGNGITADQIADIVKSAIEQGIQAGIAMAAAAIPAEPAPAGEGA